MKRAKEITSIYVQRSTLKLSDQNPEVMMIKLFNKLPETLKRLNDYNRFSSEVKRFLIEHSFYDLDEFMNC